ncbi:MAG: hypothetical protein RSB76_02010 [Clostridia bacterium]
MYFLKKYYNYILLLFICIIVIVLLVTYNILINSKHILKAIDYEKLNEPIIFLTSCPNVNSITATLNICTLSNVEKIDDVFLYIGKSIDDFNICKKNIKMTESIAKDIQFSQLESNTTYYIKCEVIYNNKTYVKISDKLVTLEKEYENIEKKDTFAYIYQKILNTTQLDVKFKNDLTPPSVATVILPKEVFVNQEFDAYVKHNDSLSGINISECRYIFSDQIFGYDVVSKRWKMADKFLKNEQILKLKASKEGIYYLHILSKDMYNNWRESIKSVKVIENTGGATRDKKQVNSNIPYIPKNFKYLEGDVGSGFVIQDIYSQNEFVWIPVDGINIKFERNSFNKYYSKNFNQYFEALDENVKNSINKYGGFYIARYEAGIDKVNGIPLSKKNIKPWVYIDIETALKSATLMYNNSDIKTQLTSSYMWDTMLTWLKLSGIKIDISSEFGNYFKENTPELSVKTLTGINEKFKLNNIYDIAGNMYEWTSETFMQDFAVIRGGSYLETGDELLMYRNTFDGNLGRKNISFRVAMYLI